MSESNGQLFKETSGAKRKAMTRDQEFRVYDWLRLNELALQAQCPTMRQVFDRATEETGFDMSYCSFKALVEDSGITWGPDLNKPVDLQADIRKVALAVRSLMFVVGHVTHVLKTEPINSHVDFWGGVAPIDSASLNEIINRPVSESAPAAVSA